MASRTRSRVTDRGQVTIPKWLRERLGIKPGETLEFAEGEEGALVARKTSTDSVLDSAYGVLDLDRSTDQFIEELRGKADPA